MVGEIRAVEKSHLADWAYFAHLYIEGIAGAPAFQRNGIAHQLLEFAQSWAKEKGVYQLASDCDMDNAVSQAFHKSAGFEEISRTVHYMLHLDKKG